MRSRHLGEGLVLEEGVEGALPLLVVQGLEELLDRSGHLGLSAAGGGGCCSRHGGAGGHGTKEAGANTAAAAAAAATRAAHAVAEVLQPRQEMYKYFFVRSSRKKVERFYITTGFLIIEYFFNRNLFVQTWKLISKL